MSARVQREPERPLHSSGSRSEDSKNEWGLPCEDPSMLPPKPEDKLMMEDRKDSRSQVGNGDGAAHLCSMLHLSQSNPPERFSSNKLTQLVPVRCMASATVYLLLPRAHLSIFMTLRSDWRKRCSRLSDNNKGVCRTLKGRDRLLVSRSTQVA